MTFLLYTGNYHFMQPEPQGAVGGAAAAPPPPPRPPPPEAKKRKKEKAALLPVLAFTPTNKVIKMDHYNINKPAAKQQHQQQAEAKQAVEQAAADSKAGQAMQQPKHIPGGSCMPISHSRKLLWITRMWERYKGYPVLVPSC